MSCGGDDSVLGRVVLTVNGSLSGTTSDQLVSHRLFLSCFLGVVPTGLHVDVRMFSQRS